MSKIKFRQRKLWMVHEDDKHQERLYLARGVYPHERPARPDEETLKAMADMLDLHAEDCNAPEFVGVHRGLAVILSQEVGLVLAQRVMRRVVNYEGLFGLTGVCGEGDVDRTEQELGVSLHDWSEWNL